MGKIASGLLAGAAATAVLSTLMIAKAMMGIMPELDLPVMISSMMGASGSPVVGWGVHAMIGVVGYGLAIALMDGVLPSRSRVLHGVLLGLGGWAMMMATLMPMAGAGFFGMSLGMTAPMMTLVLHVIFGAFLGAAFGISRPTAKIAA